MRLVEFNDYLNLVRDGGTSVENSDFHKRFMTAMREGRCDKDYVSPWKLDWVKK